MNSLTHDMIVEVLLNAFTLSGYKVLLKSYECPKGEIDLIAKKNGVLCFVGLDKTEEAVNTTARYYMDRYGIKGVRHRILVL